MSAPETTPAVERAQQQINAMLGPTEPKFVPNHARSVLNAALDRQEIARSLYERHAADVEWCDQVTLCDWADVEQTTGEAYLEEADGVIATVLGARDDGAPDPWAARLATEPPRRLRATTGQRVTSSREQNGETWFWECDHAHEGDTDWCGSRLTQDAAYTALDEHNAANHPHLTEEARRAR